MAFTQSNITRGSRGNMYSYSGTFTSASGDTALTVNHGMNFIVEQHVGLNRVGAENPIISNSAGTATVTWDDTKGSSGSYFFVGR